MLLWSNEVSNSVYSSAVEEWMSDRIDSIVWANINLIFWSVSRAAELNVRQTLRFPRCKPGNISHLVLPLRLLFVVFPISVEWCPDQSISDHRQVLGGLSHCRSRLIWELTFWIFRKIPNSTYLTSYQWSVISEFGDIGGQGHWNKPREACVRTFIGVAAAEVMNKCF
jgi:hypothetical protein